MRAVLAYSWQRLTRKTAQTIAGVSLRTLWHLIDKSFLQRTAGERYDIHELLRQYGEAQLHSAGQEQKVRDARSAFFLHFVGSREAALAGAQQITALSELATEFENIRTAWRWAVQTHNYSGIDRALGGVFRWFWLMRSRQHEGQALLRYALEQWAPAPDEDPRPVWMRLSARIMEQSGPTLIYDPEMVERTDRALDFARQQGNLDEIAFCLWAHGFAVLVDHDRDMNTRRPEAIGFLERSLQYYRERGDRFYIAQGLELSGHCYRQLRVIDQAAPRLQESLEIRRALGDPIRNGTQSARTRIRRLSQRTGS